MDENYRKFPSHCRMQVRSFESIDVFNSFGLMPRLFTLTYGALHWWHVYYWFCRGVVPGGAMAWHPQILADQLNLSQPGGTDYAHLITTGTSGFSDLPTALFWWQKSLLVKKAVSAIDLVVEHNGADFLKPKVVMSMSWYQVHVYDIFAFIVLLISLFLWFMFKLCSCFLRCFIKKTNQEWLPVYTSNAENYNCYLNYFEWIIPIFL